MDLKPDGSSVLKSVKFFEEKLQGQLNVKNRYQILEDDKSNFYVEVNIDKVFSTEGVKALALQDKVRLAKPHYPLE